jgi:hypothetical protein
VYHVNGFFFMLNSRGGRGKKAPYEQTHMRVPLPIKARVAAIIDAYRASVLGDDAAAEEPKAAPSEVSAALKLLQRFLKDGGIDRTSYDRPTRDNRNLKRFEQWLMDQL